MRLQFDGQDWLHVLMAVRLAQRRLSDGPDRTDAWDRQRGAKIIEQLTFLVRRNPNAPQIAEKIDLSILDSLLGLKTPPETPPAAPSNGPSDADFRALLAEVTQKNEAAAKERVKIFEFLAQLEDRVILLERRRK